MTRVAIVVQRCHDTVVGGSEAEAWQYAQLLKSKFDIEVLTTTALDAVTWDNELPAKSEERAGVIVRRFAVDIGRSDYWRSLHDRLLADFDAFQNGDKRRIETRWTLALQEEFIRHQGPYSTSLLNYLGDNAREYAAILFFTYLFPTTYFGIQRVPVQKTILVPTLHNEAPAYLPAYKFVARRARHLIWNTAAEARLGAKLWGHLEGDVVGMAVNTECVQQSDEHGNFILYCGRISPAKGCSELFEYFRRYKNENSSSDLRLLLIGNSELEIPDCPDIEYLGFATESEKFTLIASANFVVVPSPYESLSLVALEAMAQRVPVIANGKCQVLADHIAIGKGGMLYDNYSSFARALKTVESESIRRELGVNGRSYVIANYDQNKIKDAIVSGIERQSAGMLA
ncbi:MAG TPA: glycosyltransferase family 4 protein [Gammaproteobacteria bacterium]|nr:glycosyltransferase family 4 protein [Gammaproteobacteria bacterium]